MLSFVGLNVKKTEIATLFLGLKIIGNVFCFKLTMDREERMVFSQDLFQTNLQLKKRPLVVLHPPGKIGNLKGRL